MGPKGNASRTPELSPFEERIRRKAEEYKSAINEERMRREAERGCGGGGGGNGGSEHGKAERGKGRRRFTTDDPRVSMPISNPSSAVNEFEKRLRRKMERDGVGGSGANGGTKHRRAERGKARRRFTADDPRASTPISRPSLLVNEFEEKIRRRLETDSGGGNGDNGGSEHGKDEHDKAKKMFKRLDSSKSVPTLSPSSVVNEFEEKFRRKMKRDGGGGSGDNGGFKHGKAGHGKARHRFKRDDSSKSMPTPVSSSRCKFKSKDRSASMPIPIPSPVVNEVAIHRVIGDGLKTPPAATDEEARCEASNVGFEEMFVHLQRYKEEYGSLSIPASHSDFSHILDTLSSVGMEELLRKHWEQRLGGLMAFKEKNDNCLVPETHSTLGTWARIQRDHYVMYTMKLPSPMTRERFNRLKDLGFDEFASWEGDNKQKDPKEGKGSEGRASSESKKEETSVDIEDLNLNQKSEREKIHDKVKFVERALLARHSSSLNKKMGEEPEGKAAVAEEMYQKRMLLRASRKGLGLKASLVIAQTINDKIGPGGIDGDPAASPERDNAGLRCSFAGLKRSLMFSSSSSNLCPGSWECTKCTYINEPVGLGAKVASCRACGAWKCWTCTFVNEALSLNCTVCNDRRQDWDGVSGRGSGGWADRPNFASARSKDDLAIGSWRPFGDEALQVVMAQSMADLGIRQVERQSMADLEIHRAQSMADLGIRQAERQSMADLEIHRAQSMADLGIRQVERQSMADLEIDQAQSMADLGIRQAERQSMASLEIHRAEVPLATHRLSMPLSTDCNQRLLDHAGAGATRQKMKKEKSRKKKRRTKKEKRERRKEGTRDLDDDMSQCLMSMHSLGFTSMHSLGVEKF